MLSEDVRDQPQFETLAKPEPDHSPLREQFELPEAQPYYAQPEHLQDGSGAKLAMACDTMALLLKNCLTPEPLTGPKPSGLNADVMANLSPLQQHKQLALAPEPELSWQLADQALLKMLNQQKLNAQAA